MSSWEYYIASCLRIADLVESRRELGTVPVFNKQAVGREDALWLTTGISILEYLKERAGEVGTEYVSIFPVIEALLHDYPSVQEDDIMYVCHVLSCETVFHYSDGEKVYPVGQTALIEQLNISRQYRLTKTGRRVTNYANEASDVIDSDDNARKILKAIEMGDYGRAMDICKSIRIKLVEFSHELRRAQERPGGSVLLEDITRHREIFERVMKNTHDIITQAQARMKDTGMDDKVNVWNEDHNADITAPGIRRYLKELAGVLEVLSRNFMQEIYNCAKFNRQQGVMFNFKSLARAFVFNSPSASLINGFIRSTGPSRCVFSYLIPDDLRGCARSYDTESIEVIQEFDDEAEVPDTPRWFSDLLSQHRNDILEELTQKGFVTFQMGIEKGWFLKGDKEQLSSMAGIYRCPECFGLPNKTLTVGIGREFKAQTVASLFGGDDLVLILRKSVS